MFKWNVKYEEPDRKFQKAKPLPLIWGWRWDQPWFWCWAELARVKCEFVSCQCDISQMHIYISDVKVSLLSPAYPSHLPAIQDIYTEDSSNEFVISNILVCLLHLGCAAVQPWSCTLCSLGEIKKTLSALMVVVVGTHPILPVLWH